MMIVRSLDDVRDTKVDVRGDMWSSARLLLEADGLGFTITETILEPGMDEVLWYKHHVEACYCVEGDAVLTDLETNETFQIRPGTLYALDRHDRHRLRSQTRVRLMCVFSPALKGTETHDADGSYSISSDEA